MIKLFEKIENDKYLIIKILFIKITFKKKNPKFNLYNLGNRFENKIEELNEKIRYNDYLLNMSKNINHNTFLQYKNINQGKEIVGGHLSLWNAGLLLYQLVIAGFDCREAIVKKYRYNISVIVRKNKINIKNKLVYDNGDISTIKQYLPKQIEYDNNFKDISFCGDIESIGW